jgi:hypothetical protein
VSRSSHDFVVDGFFPGITGEIFFLQPPGWGSGDSRFIIGDSEPQGPSGKPHMLFLLFLLERLRAQATSDFSPENIRATAASLKESPFQITSRLPPRTGRRYIVVGGVSEGT